MSASIPVRSWADLTPTEVSAYYSLRAPSLRQRGSAWRGPCPIHDGQDDNFAVEPDTGLWFCHSQCSRGGSVYDLEMALSNADFRDAASSVRHIVGRADLREIEPEPEMKWGLPGWSLDFLRQRIKKVEQRHGWKHTTIYPYFRLDGRVSYVEDSFHRQAERQDFPTVGCYVESWLGYPKEDRCRAAVMPLEHACASGGSLYRQW